MGYVGNQQTEGFSQVPAKQDLTGATGTSLTLSHAVASAEGIDLFINNVRQEPTTAYSVGADGVTVTLTGSVVATDDIYVVYNSLALQTTVPPDASVSTAKIIDGSVTSAKLDTNMVVNGTLGVGISPQTKLHVAAAGNFNQTVRIEDTSISGRRLDLSYNSTGPYIWVNNSEPFNIYTGGSTRFEIDASGRVTKPNQPRFRVRNSGMINYTTSGADLSWGVEDFDVGNNFSGSTFTCPVDGVYFFSFNVFANTGNSANVDMLHNGNIIGRAERQDATGGYQTIGLSLIFPCSANDTVKLKLNSGQVHTNGSLNYFTGYLVC